MMDYRSYFCDKCGKIVLRTEGIEYCGYCGARLPEIKKLPKVTCPMCHGTGEVDQQAIQQPHFTYFNNKDK